MGLFLHGGATVCCRTLNFPISIGHSRYPRLGPLRRAIGGPFPGRSTPSGRAIVLTFQCGHASLQLGCQERPRIGVHYLIQLSRLGGCELAARDGCDDCCEASGGVSGLA